MTKVKVMKKPKLATGRPKKVNEKKLDMDNLQDSNAQHYIAKKLQDWKWRITSGKLYHIKDKEGRMVPFIPNKAQLHFLENMHNKNIILKARQLGFSTLIDIMVLDYALFNKFYSCGVIAQNLDAAKDIFDNKIRFAYDKLPEWLRSAIPIKVDKQGYLTFSKNESRVSVDDSFRSGTLQVLHISEYGKICAQFPKKAAEVRTGALNTLAPNQYIFIESTAEGNSGDFYDKTQEAIAKQLADKPLSEMDYKFFFYPWFLEPAYTLKDDFIPITQETKEYFQNIKEEVYFAKNFKSVRFTEGQMRWYQEKKKEQKELMKREYPTIPDEAFENAIRGAYYLKETNLAVEQKRICRVKHDPKLKTYTAWDLGGAGGGDDTAIWFWQKYGREYRLIDYWEGNGYSMMEICEKVVNDKVYDYETHFLPHDAKVHEYTTGKTRYEEAREMLRGDVDVIDKVAVSDGVNAVRSIFSQCFFDEENTTVGFGHLTQYSRSWDDTNGIFRDRPKHDGHSNAADSFRYFALSCENTDQQTQVIHMRSPFKSWIR